MKESENRRGRRFQEIGVAALCFSNISLGRVFGRIAVEAREIRVVALCFAFFFPADGDVMEGIEDSKEAAPAL